MTVDIECPECKGWGWNYDSHFSTEHVTCPYCWGIGIVERFEK